MDKHKKEGKKKMAGCPSSPIGDSGTQLDKGITQKERRNRDETMLRTGLERFIRKGTIILLKNSS